MPKQKARSHQSGFFVSAISITNAGVKMARPDRAGFPSSRGGFVNPQLSGRSHVKNK